MTYEDPKPEDTESEIGPDQLPLVEVPDEGEVNEPVTDEPLRETGIPPKEE